MVERMLRPPAARQEAWAKIRRNKVKSSGADADDEKAGEMEL
jgi:hypothetical protein